MFCLAIQVGREKGEVVRLVAILADGIDINASTNNLKPQTLDKSREKLRKGVHHQAFTFQC